MKPANRNIFLIIILIIATAVYWNHFDNEFQFDDFHTIQENLWIRDMSNAYRFFVDGSTISTLPYNQAYRPLVTLLNAIDYAWWGAAMPQPFPFHVSIFISFLLLGIIVRYFFQYILSISGDSKWVQYVSLFGMAWFLLHTANAETINYIIARTDSFSTLLVMVAFWVYLAFPKLRKWHLYAVPALVGFLAKETALMFFPLLFVYQLLFEQQLSIPEWFRQPAALTKPMERMILPLLAAIGLFILSRSFTPDAWRPGGTNTLRYLFTQPFVAFHYVYNFILPVNLVVDTDWKIINSYTDDRVLAGLLFVGLLLYVVYRCSFTESTRPISFGILWFFIALLPTSSIIPFSEVLNDHRTFFPYIGLFLATLCLLQNGLMRLSANRLRMAGFVGIIFLGLHVWGTVQRNAVWDSGEKLWQEATIKAPANPRSWLNYGNIVMGKARYTEAIQCFETSIQLAPNYVYPFINRAIAKAAIGDNRGAELDFQQALRLDTVLPGSYAFYARFLMNQGRTAEAKPLLEKGLQLSPKHQLMNQLWTKYENTKPEKALLTAEAAVKAQATPEAYLDLSLRYYQNNRFEDCIRAAEAALKLKPDYDLAYNNICAAYNQLQQWDKAIEAGEKGLRINPNNQLLKNNLAASYAGKK